MDRRRTRFADAVEIRRRLGEALPVAFDGPTVEAMRAEVEGLPWGVAEDITIALAGEHAGIGARSLQRLVDPSCQLNVFHRALVRGRARLGELRLSRRR